MGFAELSITSNFTFLTGGSHPEEYARRAALLGLPAIAIADVVKTGDRFDGGQIFGLFVA